MPYTGRPVQDGIPTYDYNRTDDASCIHEATVADASRPGDDCGRVDQRRCCDQSGLLGKIRQLTAELTEEKTQRLLVVEDLANQKGLMHDAVTMERQQGELQRRELHATVAGELDATHGRLRDAEAQLQHVVRQQRVASLGKYLI